MYLFVERDLKFFFVCILGADKLSKQQEVTWPCQGLWPPLQHGPRECEGNVDWGIWISLCYCLIIIIMPRSHMSQLIDVFCILQIPKTGKGKKKALPVNKDRFISKMFLRGDSVIIVLRNPKWGPRPKIWIWTLVSTGNLVRSHRLLVKTSFSISIEENWN